MSIANTHFPGIPSQDGSQLCAVLVRDDNHPNLLFAVYIGIVRATGNDKDRAERAEWVALRGSKLRYKEALQHFPGLREEQYRA